MAAPLVRVRAGRHSRAEARARHRSSLEGAYGATEPISLSSSLKKAITERSRERDAHAKLAHVVARTIERLVELRERALVGGDFRAAVGVAEPLPHHALTHLGASRELGRELDAAVEGPVGVACLDDGGARI